MLRRIDEICLRPNVLKSRVTSNSIVVPQSVRVIVPRLLIDNGLVSQHQHRCGGDVSQSDTFTDIVSASG
jgi:hypothetical protein